MKLSVEFPSVSYREGPAAVATLCDALLPEGGSWGDDGTLIQFDLSADGLVFRGVKEGETLCSAASASKAT